MTPTIVLCECIVQRHYLFFVKLCFDNIMSIIMKVSYMKSNNIVYMLYIFYIRYNISLRGIRITDHTFYSYDFWMAEYYNLDISQLWQRMIRKSIITKSYHHKLLLYLGLLNDFQIEWGACRLEMPVPSQGHYGFHSFPVVDWFCLFI